jgi:hypothetical protein
MCSCHRPNNSRQGAATLQAVSCHVQHPTHPCLHKHHGSPEVLQHDIRAATSCTCCSRAVCLAVLPQGRHQLGHFGGHQGRAIPGVCGAAASCLWQHLSDTMHVGVGRSTRNQSREQWYEYAQPGGMQLWYVLSSTRSHIKHPTCHGHCFSLSLPQCVIGSPQGAVSHAQLQARPTHLCLQGAKGHVLQQPQHAGPQPCSLPRAAGDACYLDLCSNIAHNSV